VSAAFLRELAEIIHYAPTVKTGLTELHVDALRDTADLLEAQSKEIHDRANAQLQLVADRERLIYHTLSVLAAPYDEDRAPRDLAELCLAEFGYTPDSARAIRMLELGEPGKGAAPSRRDFAIIPSKILAGLKRYGEHGTGVGDFLQAVIANDFRDAACRADEQSFRALTAIAIYVHQELPGKCHGSRVKYETWLKAHEVGS